MTPTEWAKRIRDRATGLGHLVVSPDNAEEIRALSAEEQTRLARRFGGESIRPEHQREMRQVSNG